MTLNLSILPAKTGTATVSACSSYTWVNGVTYTASTSTPTYIYTAANGCDSVVSLNLVINNSNFSTDVITACDSHLWIDGVIYTSNNFTATHTLTNVNGCDSIVTLALTILTIDDTIVLSNLTIYAIPGYDSYQWYECTSNGLIAMIGENKDSVLILSNGDYAVAITNGSCADTSVCLHVGDVNLREEMNGKFYVKPNPTNGLVDIISEIPFNSIGIYTMNLFDIHGKLILEKSVHFQNGIINLNLGNLPSGVYQLTFSNAKEIFREKIYIVN